VGDELLIAKQAQYAVSIHRTGGHLFNFSSCGSCHSHQGFLERIDTDAYGVTASVEDPVYINCRTCHQIHTTYTDADFAFTATTPFDLYNEDITTLAREEVDWGADAGNLCGRCHQARPLRERVGANDDVNDIPQIGGPDVEITSSRFGYHYGTQGQVLAGIGAYEFTGSMTIGGGPATHGNPASNTRLCATCHMAFADDVDLGGHTWNVALHVNGREEQNVAGCNEAACHNGSVMDFTALGDVQGQVLPLLMRLDTLLVDRGIKQMYSPGYGIHDIEYFAITGTYNADLAAALANWNMFAWDRSKGLHNPAYARSVLTNTVEVVEAIPAFVTDNWASADIVRGALLYDKWWPVNAGTEPTTDFDPIWASQTTNTRSGGDTWRCKECHGWDYIGNLGRYSSGSHFTGFAGVWTLRDADTLQVFQSIKGTGGDHDMSGMLSDTDVLDLTKFIADGLVDISLYLDQSTGLATGDPVAGQPLYVAACPACHGLDGLTIDFDPAPGIQGVGWLADDNPQETLHKIRWGHPGSSPMMPSQVGNGLTDQQTGDILAYTQTLPNP
jgi:thiosulfate dehydrogenase